MQKLLSQSSSNTVPHCALKCISLQNSREIQCPEMTYRLTCKCFLSALHHNNKMSETFRSHWGIYITYIKGCPQRHWEFPASQGQGIRWKRLEYYERKLKEIRSPCVGQSYGYEVGTHDVVGQLALSKGLILLWATVAEHEPHSSMVFLGASCNGVLQTPLAFWTSNRGSPDPAGLYHSLH